VKAIAATPAEFCYVPEKPSWRTPNMSDNTRELNLSWITSPPIIVLQPNEVAQRLKQLKDNLQGWGEVTEPSNPLPIGTTDRAGTDFDVTDWKSPKRTQQERWNDRARSTNSMVNVSFGGDQVVEYRVAGEPVGIMAVKFWNPLYICDLVCHPGSADGGGILIEYAVNLSAVKNDNHEACVELWALDDDALQAYRRLGFRSIQGDNEKSMRLDPANSSGVWTNTKDGWRLTKYAVWGKFVA
jgi:hypothetical protein